MRIELEYPYNEEYRHGYLLTNKEPRRLVILYKTDTERKTISYARYLYTITTGEFLSDSVEVDHINDDKMDDRFDNYQLLSSRENAIKRNKHLGITKAYVDFICGTCGTPFTKARNLTHLVIKAKKSTYCCRRCSAIGTRMPSTIIQEYSI